MLSPKLITHIKRITGPIGPSVLKNASEVNVTPELSDDNHTPLVKIMTAVKVHIIKVSNIGPVIAIKPCFTGFDVLAVPCISASVPIPASLLNAPLLIPVKITPIKPPLTAEFNEKASVNIKEIDGRNLS